MTYSRVLVLLPPSEGKHEGGEGVPIHTVHRVTEELLTALLAADPANVYPTRTAEAQAINARIRTSPTLPAIERYSGVVYDALDYASLDARATQYVQDHCIIMSALFGPVRANEPLPNYVLSMTKLRSAQRWREDKSTIFGSEVFVIDLLPDTHRKAVTYTNGVRIDFTFTQNGKTLRTGHEGKRIKGRYARWLAQNAVQTREEALQFSEEGYAWNGERFHRT